jgi:hypothetical protein
LIEAGLVEEAGTRTVNRKRETVYGNVFSTAHLHARIHNRAALA